ncbi:MAG: hypothetical protein GY679_04865 [Mycoplasma sp.]|nr:hypothetical protein [Mycoplasma sp.]
MKLKELINIKALFTKKVRFTNILEYTLSINTFKKSNWKAFGNSSGKKIIKILSNFTTPQYNVIYFMRNRSGYQTLSFRQNYDVIITDKDGTILKFEIDVKPGMISKKVFKGYIVAFLPVGTILHFGLKEKDNFKFNRKWF